MGVWPQNVKVRPCGPDRSPNTPDVKQPVGSNLGVYVINGSLFQVFKLCTSCLDHLVLIENYIKESNKTERVDFTRQGSWTSSTFALTPPHVWHDIFCFIPLLIPHEVSLAVVMPCKRINSRENSPVKLPRQMPPPAPVLLHARTGVKGHKSMASKKDHKSPGNPPW